MNKVLISGEINDSFDLKTTQGGKEVVSLFLKSYNDPEKKSYITIECTFWGALAESVYAMCDKGDYLEILGKIVKQQYQDKSNKTQYKTFINVETFEVLGANNRQKEAVEQVNKVANSYKKKQETQETLEYDDADLPF